MGPSHTDKARNNLGGRKMVTPMVLSWRQGLQCEHCLQVVSRLYISDKLPFYTLKIFPHLYKQEDEG